MSFSQNLEDVRCYVLYCYFGRTHVVIYRHKRKQSEQENIKGEEKNLFFFVCEQVRQRVCDVLLKDCEDKFQAYKW